MDNKFHLDKALGIIYHSCVDPAGAVVQDITTVGNFKDDKEETRAWAMGGYEIKFCPFCGIVLPKIHDLS
jgi:hypothetical protein